MSRRIRVRWACVLAAALVCVVGSAFAQDESGGDPEDTDETGGAGSTGDAVADAPADEPAPVPLRELNRPGIPAFGGYGGFTLGTVILDLTEINEFVDRESPGGAAGLDGFVAAMPTWGIEAHAVLARRFVVGGQISAYVQYSTADYFDTAVGGYFGWIEFGYNAYNTMHLNVRPWAGLGGFGMSLLFDGDLRRVGFVDEEDREDDQERAVLYTGAGIVAAGITVEATPYFMNRNDTFGGMSVQLKLGGFVQLAGARWEYEGSRVSDAPDLRFDGGYAALHVLFGGGSTEPL